MERYKLILSYEGRGFAGSQRQTRRRTVQSELETALRSLGWSGRSILLAGRTDSGVHASGQVAACDLEWKHGPEALRDALNAKLPSDMAIRLVEPASPAFHPRFDARSRKYRYRIYCQPVRDPLRDPSTWRLWPPPEFAVLEQTARLLAGRHDFAAFGSPPGARGGTVRTVLSACWDAAADELGFEVEADAFLYRMVRRLVFVQVAAAHGRVSPEAVQSALTTASVPGSLPAGLAPANGLVLLEVNY